MSNLQYLENAVVGLILSRNLQHLTTEDIRSEAVKLARAFEVKGDDLEKVIRQVEARLVIVMGEGTSLVDTDSEHDDEWPSKREIEWHYWKDYANHLEGSGWPPLVAHSLGDITAKILGLLEEPEKPDSWDRRGLVIGHVQSGKTANYLGLITRAADAGYKLIIVLAGIHENLRKQTQQRIDEGFVGRDSNPDRMRREIGVGVQNRNHKFPVSLTNTQQDFTKQVATGIVADLQGFSQPVVVVIKKNVTTLSNLYSWLKEWNTRESSQQIANVPMLMIDDEADNASVNTNKADIDPTRTNREIRKILKLFKKKCYVGYTATPFANIFINPDSESEMLNDDLFPRDFIYCLDAPTNYFGAERVFLDEEQQDIIVQPITDAEDFIPLAHKTKDFPVSDVPPSLKNAIHVFIVAKAIRMLRGQDNKHASMMVNVSRFVNVQKQVREHISFYLATVAKAVRYNHALPVAEAMKNGEMRALKAAYDEEFSSLKEKWPEIQKVLAKAVDVIKVLVVNSKSDESLDYRKAEDNNEALTVIAVGGLSLSRGLTLEGLTVSYMYRNTKMYDTLMQMGRWFGYRDNYDDLCKVYLSEDSIGWYEHIAEAAEELRQNIKQMRRDGIKPKQFGLYVRAHPDALTVTALNKMRDTEIRPLQVTYSGGLVESHIVPKVGDITEQNRLLFRELYSRLEQEYPGKGETLDGALFWKAVNWEVVDDFLFKFRYHRKLQIDKAAVRAYLRKVSEKYPEVDIAFISLKNEKGQMRFHLSEDSSSPYILSQERTVGRRLLPGDVLYSPKEPPEEPGYYITNKQRVSGRGAEAVGLSAEQIAEATQMAEEGKTPGQDKVEISDAHYRNVRGRPLLMLHSLKLVHKQPKGKDGKEPVGEDLLDQIPAIGMAFPGGDYETTVDYVVNKVWLKQLELESFDSPDEEDDYDD
jgi:hypothetical protein